MGNRSTQPSWLISQADNIEGTFELLGGPAARYPYDGVAANAIWPVSLDTFKAHAQIDHDADDELILDEFAGYLVDAVEEIETRGQVGLINQRRRLVLSRLPSEESIWIPRRPLVSVEAIGYLDEESAEQTLATSLYSVRSKSRKPSVYFRDTGALSTADGEGVCWIDVTVGYGTTAVSVPAQWRELVLSLAVHRYERRELMAGGGLDEAFEKVLARKVIAAGGSQRYV